MSHTYRYKTNPEDIDHPSVPRGFRGGPVTIHCNGDYSGNASICFESGEEFNVPCRVLLEFAAGFVRSERIQAAEAADTAELLGVKRVPR